MFKHAQDKLPVALIVAFSIVDLAAYFLIENFWVFLGYWLLLLLPKGVICAWNHHHQHVFTFRSPALNRLYELSLAFHSGITSNLWLLHHGLGHHLHFLDQTKDESGWKRKSSGRKMGVIEYTIDVTITAYYRAFQVGRRYPKHQRIYLRWTAITFVLLGLLIWYRPLAGVMIYALPMLTSLLFTVWVTYDHHSGLESKEQFEASYNIMSPVFNALTGNLGYHTAHHYRQAVHWSKLPELHRTIAHKIPAALYRESTFKAMLPNVRKTPGAVSRGESVPSEAPGDDTGAQPAE